jgi:hypothetical protein
VEGLDALRRWGLGADIHLLPVCSGTVSKHVLLEAAAAVAHDVGADVIVTGERLGDQLAPAAMVVLRPLYGLDPEEAARWMAFAGILPADAASIIAADASESAERMLGLHQVITP